MKHGKKYQDSSKLFDSAKLYDTAEAIDLCTTVPVRLSALSYSARARM